jgi:glutamate synthase domain-containing protein 2/glutamate synthase domain-containing protein 1/glutamate synthase domain-containing protein 3
MTRPLKPKKQGLYDPQFEHDSCGVGFVANIKGVKSHDIIEKGLQVLLNLTHRGATGADPETGDGAGLLMQMPHLFLKEECRKTGIDLPAVGGYGAGLVFLPRDVVQRNRCEELLEYYVRQEGQALLGWRDVPTDNRLVGRTSKEGEPVIRQIFVGSKAAGPAALERKLYLIRKQVERRIRESDLTEKSFFYVPSLSARVLVYKGQLMAHQIKAYYPDLSDPRMESALVLIHQRYSTNTFPSWRLAHPYRFLAHNGEINTLRGNINWMRAREATMASPLFGEDLKKIFPVIEPGGSDSASFDNALELLVMAGRPIAHAMMMLIPEAWARHDFMEQERRDFYEYHAKLMEPWDGPAAMAFTDGTVIGATLDRNGLRPARYVVTKDDLVVMASEAGVLDIPPDRVLKNGRLEPGKMFLVDTAQGRIIGDKELKHALAMERPYGQWLRENQFWLDELTDESLSPAADVPPEAEPDDESLCRLQMTFGYSVEDQNMIMAPMAVNGEEAVGSMGTDTSLACLSDKPQLLYNYFKQLFAQVTNPPIDPIREELVMSLSTTLGSEQNLLDATPKHARKLKIKHPVLANEELARLRRVSIDGLASETIPMLFPAREGAEGLKRALDEICRRASDAIRRGVTILILSDRGVDEGNAPIPSLLAMAAVHHHLIRERTRTRAGIVVESGEAREVMHFALLIGYGAGAVNPYLAFRTLERMCGDSVLPESIDPKKAVQNYIKAIDKGLLKVISKMGISTIQSYRGAQIFEAIGLDSELVDRYFTGTASRLSGAGIEIIAEETLARHRSAYPSRPAGSPCLRNPGQYHWRRDGEYHMYNPDTIARLQHAVRSGSARTYREYAEMINDVNRSRATLRSLLDFRWAERAVPIDEVEPAKEIVKRFATGAMSFGSISKETHETLAIAMNRIGGRSNTGEGGEDPDRFLPDPNGDSRRSAVKQVASGRFGVTSHYLVNADELQIKMAQGAKPGEGGQLPGHKVDKIIAKVRHSTPGVGLISPPPHHDIYSIEDLAQLIYDLKNANPRARISVKLVAEVGVGTIAAGVAKAKSDVVLISGHDGGTGASPLTSIKHAGVPWELGLAETHQVLVMNDLRGRIVVQTDGQIKTGRDVAVAALLGAEEFGFATAPLIALGCIMMRKCHLNTCPVGVATQDPELRKKFEGAPEHLINFFFFVAEELREIMARLGFRTVTEMVGRVDRLDPVRAMDHWKARRLDLSPLLHKPDVPARVATHKVQEQDHGIDKALDYVLLEKARPAIENGTPVEIEMPIRNVHRTVGTILGSEVSRRHGGEGLPDDTIICRFKGTAGQSFGAFVPRGITLILEGDANDYLGKGLSGGRIVVFPPSGATYVPEENIIVGNTLLYGATSGEVFIRGMAGERFAVRNSGAVAVVEGTGDHGCEYMTGGRVVVLGKTGRNFAAGMSGGIAYVIDPDGYFAKRCNPGMVEAGPLAGSGEEEFVRGLIERHRDLTRSALARRVLDAWPEHLPRFVRVMPLDYKRVIAEARKEAVAQYG